MQKNSKRHRFVVAVVAVVAVVVVAVVAAVAAVLVAQICVCPRPVPSEGTSGLWPLL